MSRSALTWRCTGCDEHMTSWAAAERHVDARWPTCGRLELIWPNRPCTCRPYDRIRDGEHPNRCYRCSGTIGST